MSMNRQYNGKQSMDKRTSTSIFTSFITYHRVYNKSTTTGVTSGTGTAYHSGAHEFNPRYLAGFVSLQLLFLMFLYISACPFVPDWINNVVWFPIFRLWEYICTWWMLFQKRVMGTKFDMYVFIKWWLYWIIH
jgi:hypothetical protein